MKILIVHAHPEPQSFTSSMKDNAVAIFEQQGHDVLVSDLYAMQFNPVASEEDFSDRQNKSYLVYALEQRKAYENGEIADDIQQEIEKVKACDLLIFNFPLYWFSVPAILKGWIDRVMISGVFYGGKRIYDQGGMRDKKAMLSLTLGGREHMFGPQSLHGELETLLRPLQQGTLAYCGFSVLKPFYGFHIPYLKKEQRNTIMKNYCDRMQSLFHETPLAFPSLEDFDERLYLRDQNKHVPRGEGY